MEYPEHCDGIYDNRRVALDKTSITVLTKEADKKICQPQYIVKTWDKEWGKKEGFELNKAHKNEHNYCKVVYPTDKKLTDIFTDSWCFTLNDKFNHYCQEKKIDIPQYWNLTPTMIDDGKLTLLWHNSKNKDMIHSLEKIPFNAIDISFRDCGYYKKNGKILKEKENEPEFMSTRQWLQTYFQVYVDLGTDNSDFDLQTKVYANCLKDQYADNPAFDLDLLMVPNSVMLKEAQKSFPDMTNQKMLKSLTINYHVLNEFKYYTIKHEYIPDFYAYRVLGLTIETIGRLHKSRRVYENFISILNLVDCSNTMNTFVNLVGNVGSNSTYYKAIDKLLKANKKK